MYYTYSMKTITPQELLELTKTEEPVILDVRDPDEHETMCIPNSNLIPLSELESRLSELDPNKKTIVYCASGGRSCAACDILEEHGFTDVYNLQNGVLGWMMSGLPTE